MGLIDIRHRIALNTPHKETASGAIASFSTDLSAHAEVVADITPVQSGTGDPSPTNVRPISGWTGANVVRTGRNLIDGSKRYAYSNSILYIGDDDAICYIYISEGTYTLKAEFLNNAHYGAFYRERDGSDNITIWTSSGSDSVKTFTVEKTGWYRFWFYLSGGVSSANIGNVWLVNGSEAGEYTPFVANTVYPISWQTAAGTVYGGMITVYPNGTGKLIVTRGLKTFVGAAEEDWHLFSNTAGANGKRFWVQDIFSDRKTGSVNGTQIANYLVSTTGVTNSGSSTIISQNPASITFFAGDARRCYVNATGVIEEDTLSAWKTYLSNHPLQVCYLLKDQAEYNLSDADVWKIATLKGENHLFADTGDSSVTYWTH